MGAAPGSGSLTRALACAIAAALAPAGVGRAQLQTEVRVEAVATGPRRLEAGIGASARASPYLRAGVSGAREVWGRGNGSSLWRSEGMVRFTMDPLAEQRWGAALGAGLGYRGRAYLLAFAELEGPKASGMRPALQLALGGGVRLGILLRRAADGRR